MFELEITDLARGGSGVGRDASGRVVFVPYSAPGDRLKVRITQADKRYAEAEIVELLSASSLRVTPPCPAFGRCGGCKWQHLPYERQWKTKVSGALHALKRVQIEPKSAVTELPAEQVFGYRNRIQLRGDGPKLGFYAAGSHELVPLDRCEIARDEINAVWAETREEGLRLKKPYKVEIEVLPDGTVRKIWNSRHAAGGFRQVHDLQNEKLKDWVRSVMAPGRVLYDLFGGSGNLSLGLAPAMKEVHCVDLGAPRAAPAGTPAHFHFHPEAVSPWLERFAREERTQPASAILDPPREGLGPEFSVIAQSLDRLGVAQVALVGCDPDSWARDLSRFAKRGWILRELAVLDLFPQTPHVESLAFLER